MIAFIWISLAALTVWFTIVLIRDFVAHKESLEKTSWLKTSIIGFVVNFFDVLGIGAFAPQTALLKFTRQTEDKLIPGTMNVANTLPVLLQALIFITIIEVEPITLILMLVSAAIGAIIGAGIISKLSEKKIRLAMGFALLVTAAFMLARNLEWIQGGVMPLGCKVASS
jgi:uncharacterized membrane protein YfcA